MSTQASAQETPQDQTQAIEPPKFWEWGWNRSAEIWNGRLAMLAFLTLLLAAWKLF